MSWIAPRSYILIGGAISDNQTVIFHSFLTSSFALFRQVEAAIRSNVEQLSQLFSTLGERRSPKQLGQLFYNRDATIRKSAKRELTKRS